MSEPTDDESGVLYRYHFGSVVFDEARLELRVKEVPVEIESRPLTLLSKLLRERGELVSKDQLLSTVWQDEEVMEAVIPSAIKKLRRALTKDNAPYIVTVHGKGYRFDFNHGTGVKRHVVGNVPSDSLELRAGDPVPHRDSFILERLLGQSPCAEVWLARESGTEIRRVFKFATDAVGFAAIKREVTLSSFLLQALGERADLVRVYDWNLEQRPFFIECEYGGQDLAAWAAEGDRLKRMPRAERLALFMQIAEALRGPHSVAVLHKDLKPANILVAPESGGWRVRLADFGSGRLLDTAYLKQYGIDPLGLTVTQSISCDPRRGTPFYLAPELREGQAATHKSDLYALGLLLYQLWVGDFRKGLSPGWDRDVEDPLLVTDIAAATDYEPRLRLASVDALIERLQRLPHRREDLLREAQDRERAAAEHRELERSRARRPAVVMAIASLTVALVASLVMYEWQRTAHAQAETQRLRAEAIATFLNEDVIGGAAPDAPGNRQNETITEALARAQRRLDQRFVADPLTKASVQLALGEAYFGQSDYARAEALERQAVDLMAQKDPFAEAVLEGQYMLVRTLDMRAEYKQADALLTLADSHAGARLRKPSHLSLVALWARGGNELIQIHPQQALAAYQEADQVRMKVAARDPVWLFRIRGNLAWCYVRLNRSADAVAALDELMAPAYSPEELGMLDWAKAHLQYGLALTDLKRFGQAEQVMREVVQESARVVGDQHYLTGLAWAHLATTYQAEDQWANAIDADQQAYPILKQRLGERGQATLEVYGNLGAVEYLAGHLQRALSILRDAHEALTLVLGRAAPFTQVVDFYLASALVDSGHSQEAWTLAAGLEPKALAAAEASSHWEERVHALQARIQTQTVGHFAVPDRGGL